MRILIEGIGGVGGVIAGQMLRAGLRPVLVTGNPSIADAINTFGLRVTTPSEGFTVHPRAWASLEQACGDAPFDVAILVMKAAGVVEAAARTVPLLAQDGFLVTCQNGIVEDAVASAVGAERVVAAIIGWGATMHGPGVCERTGPGQNHIGELSGAVTERLNRLADLLDASAPTVISDNIQGALWSKLAINCTITSGGALLGGSLGELLRHRGVRSAFLGVYGEVMETALALGVQPERIAADPWLLYLPRGAGVITRYAKDLLVRAMGLRYGRVRSSSLQSLERGRGTEVRFLNGYVVERAGEAGVEVPLNAAMTRMITEIEAGQRRVGLDNLGELTALGST